MIIPDRSAKAVNNSKQKAELRVKKYFIEYDVKEILTSVWHKGKSTITYAKTKQIAKMHVKAMYGKNVEIHFANFYCS